MASVQVRSKPPLMRRRSEAEMLSYEVAATSTSFHVQHLNISEFENADNETLGEKFHRSISETTVSTDEPTTPTSKMPPPLLRRASLSVLEESHLNKAMMSGAFESEAEKARKARRKSFEKLRKRSSEEDRKSRKDRKSSFSTIPDG